MKRYFVVVASNDDTGLRLYEIHAPSPVIALRDAMKEDFRNYPDNPASFNAVEVFESDKSPVLSI